MKNITEALSWRYATKKFDASKKIDNATLETILESLRLSPSSYGLQPWKFVIVNNKETREKIREVAGYNQPQITDASHFIVFTNKKNIDGALVNEYINFVSKEKEIEVSSLQGFENMINGSFVGKTNEDLRNWASRQVYLAAGVLLTSCAVLGIDACPMEGINTAKLDEILNLSSENLESRMVIAIGYRAEDDAYGHSKKIRFPKGEVFKEIN